MAKETVIQHFRTLTGGKIPLPSELEQGEFFFNVTDGFVYYKRADDSIARLGETQEQIFNVTSNGTTSFPIPATAKILISVIINQLDYTEFVTINPPNSGMVIYDDSPSGGGYVTEVGDRVRIVFI